jgi:hypothetical protein
MRLIRSIIFLALFQLWLHLTLLCLLQSPYKNDETSAFPVHENEDVPGKVYSLLSSSGRDVGFQKQFS